MEVILRETKNRGRTRIAPKALKIEAEVNEEKIVNAVVDEIYNMDMAELLKMNLSELEWRVIFSRDTLSQIARLLVKKGA